MALQNAIKGHFKNENLNLSTKLGNRKKDGKAIAFAVSNESVQFQGINNGFNVIYLIFAQILVFDFNESKVIANFPVAILHSEFANEKPDAASIQNTFGADPDNYLI